MTTRDALLAAIRAQPDEDTPRLALADHLDEDGDAPEWAELIRLQIAVARSEVGSEEHGEAVWREEKHQSECLARSRADRERRGIPPWDFRTGPHFSWVGALPADLAVGTFVRGMPTSVGRRAGNYTEWTLTAEHRKGIAGVAKRFPVTRLQTPLVGRAGHLVGSPFAGERTVLELLAAWPTLDKFTALDIGHGGYLGDDQTPGLRDLAESEFAANLTELGLGGSIVDEFALGDALSSPRLRRVDTLCVRVHTDPATNNYHAIIGTPFAGRCRSLTAEGHGVAPGVVADVVSRGAVERLALNVDGFMPDPYAVAIAHNPRTLKRLRSLRFVYDGPAQLEDRSPALDEVIPAPALLGMLGSPHLTGLTELSLEGFDIGEREVKMLVASPAVRRLHALELRRCDLNDRCLSVLRPLLAEGRLRKLHLADNPMTFAAAKRLAKWPELKRLHDLRLPGSEMGDGALDAVAESPHANPFLMLSE